ncbi:outer membrane efflux domain protein [Burkholderia pseudomallei MSHR4372]|nr:outer membrane efflux domain protein [Burkholderia pseudomallei MSHR4372]
MPAAHPRGSSARRTKDEGRRTKDEAVRQIVAGQNALRASLASHGCGGDARRRRADHCDAALDAYRHGVGSITDAMLARNDLLAAQTAYADSYGAALSAAASPALATGTVAQTPEAQ